MWVRLYKCKHVRKHRGECSPSSWWEDSEDALLDLVSRWSVNLIRSMVKRDVALFVRGAQVFLSDWKRFTREHFLTSHPCRCFRPLHGLNHLEQVCNWTLGWCCFANCLLPRWRMKPNTWWHWHKPSCMNENKKVRGEKEAMSWMRSSWRWWCKGHWGGKMNEYKKHNRNQKQWSLHPVNKVCKGGQCRPLVAVRTHVACLLQVNLFQPVRRDGINSICVLSLIQTLLGERTRR